MTQYLVLGFFLTLYQMLSLFRDSRDLKLTLPTTSKYLLGRVAMGYGFGLALCWLPFTQLWIAYGVLSYSVLVYAMRLIAVVRPACFFGQVYSATQAGKQMYLAAIDADTREQADSQVQLSC